jgi:hypothetical protein
MEEILSCYGKGVTEAVTVLEGVNDATTGVKEGVNVRLGVKEGVKDGVKEGVNVIEGVNVAGWNGVQVVVAV